VKFVDLTDKPFGKLIVLGRDLGRPGRIKWVCKCECGRFTSVTGSNLMTGLTRSCGKHKKKDNDTPSVKATGVV
jgi:hypothetical protein